MSCIELRSDRFPVLSWPQRQTTLSADSSIDGNNNGGNSTVDAVDCKWAGFGNVQRGGTMPVPIVPPRELSLTLLKSLAEHKDNISPRIAKLNEEPQDGHARALFLILSPVGMTLVFADTLHAARVT